MKKYLIMLFVAAAAVFQSCDNNDDLWDSINDLKDRLTLLEGEVDALNGNIEAIELLYKGGATVSEVTEADGVYTIKLTDGTVIELTQGSDAQVVIPQVTIDENGNWGYWVGDDYYPLNVNATAEDGITPQFRITADGIWQVNTKGTDNEADWEDVKDTNGSSVSATGGSYTDKFFESVDVVDDMLVIQLRDGTEALKIPICPDVLCQIVDASGEPVTDIQLIPAGDSRLFTVNMRGIDNAILIKPEGWTASLTDPVDEKAVLTVTAPSAVATASLTRASANTSMDVAILATFGKYSCISKIQVQSGDPVQPTISVSVVDGSVTQSSLEIQVNLTNADKWRYLCVADGEEAITEVSAFDSAPDIPAATTEKTITDLSPLTKYTVYVVAYGNGLASDIKSVEATTTADQNDYYTSGVEINSTTYSKDSPGAETVTLAADASGDRTIPARAEQSVFFIEPKQSITYNYVMAPTSSVAVEANNIYIGRYADQRPTINVSRYLALCNSAATVAFKNLVLDFSNNIQDNYLFNFAALDKTGGIGTLIFEDCEIIFAKANLITAYNATGAIKNIIFRNSKIKYTGTGASYIFNLTNVGSTFPSVSTQLASVVVENCIVYSTQCNNVNCAFMSTGNSTLDLSNLELTVENNTFVDFRGSGTNLNNAGTFVLNQFKSISCKNNIFYSTIDTGYPAVFALTKDYSASAWPTIDMERTSNISHGGNNGQTWKMYSQVANTYYPGCTEDPKPTITIATIDGDPLSTCNTSTGEFVKDAAYADYGSSLK